MKTLDLIGYKRDKLGKKTSRDLRLEGSVPCVLYGGDQEVHFYMPMYLFKDLVYTPNIYEIILNVEGDEYRCVMQDVQFHPVSEVILHADFLLLNPTRPIKMDVPIKFVGTAIGISKGGKLVSKLRKIKVKSLPQYMPDYIEVDISGLDLGKSVKIGSLTQENYQILNNSLVTIATIEIPRALKSQMGKG
jgi:large subunit ribosomal protein L25